jgi:CRP-like cAMP-binding protein
MSVMELAPANTDFLSMLAPAARERLLSSSRRVDYPAGCVMYRPGEGERVLIVTRGIVRIYFQDADGRQATVFFGHSSSIVGIINALGQIPQLFGQAIVRTSAVQIDHRVLREIIKQDVMTANVVAGYLATRLRKTMELVSLRTLGSIRERLAYDLLDRACRHQLETGHLMVHASQTELADSIGTSREVAGRALAVLRSDGLITTRRGAVSIENPTRLANIFRDFTI